MRRRSPCALPSLLLTLLLAAQVHAATPARLQQEAAPARRSPILHFGAQLDALLPALHGFAHHALADAGQPPRQPLRGVYLTSGTQEGNPIDRVMGAIARHHGLQAKALPRPDGKGKAFFLNHLLQRVVIAEADLAGTTLARRRRERRVWRTGAAVVAVGLIGLGAGWLSSYERNRATVAATGQRVQQLATRVASVGAGTEALADWLPLYEVLRDLPRLGAVPADTVPAGHGFGLYQGARLARTANESYHRVLAATLAPRLAGRLVQELGRAEGDPGLRYQTLKTYLMLLQPGRLDRATVRAWAAQSFRSGPDAPVDAAQRDEWLRHVDALLERNAFQAAVVPDEAALRQARQALAAVPLPQRALARLLREAAAEPLQPPDAWFGALYPLLFEPRANVTLQVNPLFTRAGYTRHVAPRLEATLQALADEEDWVLGQGPHRRERLRTDPAARSALAGEVMRLYATAYADHWQALLGARQLVRPADADALARLNAQLAGADSPLRKLLALARTELRLVDGSGGPVGPGAAAADAVLAERFAALRPYADGPGAAALDRLLGEVSRFTLASRAGVGGGTQADSVLVRTLQQDAATAPAPFSSVWSRLAEAVQVSGQAALRQGLAARLEDVAGQCRALTHQRYPFAAAATGNDLGLADFARLFGPEGVLDGFFRRELLPHVDTGSRPWRYRGGEALAGEAVLRSFERAEDIRRTFFAPDSPVPRLQFTLRPIEMDESLEEFSMDIDGQTLLYENGPRLVRSFTWPGPAGGQRVTLRARGLRGEVHEGPWTLLRVLTRQPWSRGESAVDSRATVMLEGRRLVLEIGVRGGGSTAVLAGLASFRCPEGRP